MKTIPIFLVLLLVTLPCRAQKEPIVRDHYAELYKAGELGRLADSYVCFFDDLEQDLFFTLAEGGQIRNRVKKAGQFNALPKEEKDLLNDGTLIIRFYTDGVPGANRLLMTKHGAGWISDVLWTNDEGTKFGNDFGIDWKTLRFGYGETIIALGPPGPATCENGSQCVTRLPTIPKLSGNNGHCEKIPARVKQHGPETRSKTASPTEVGAGNQAKQDAEIVFTSSPSGAEIELDGASVGSTPFSVGVAAGDHVITMKKIGFYPWSKKINVTSGKVEVNAELEKPPDEPPQLTAPQQSDEEQKEE